MDPRNLAWQELADPNTSAARLQEIAVQFPEFHEAISKHPNVYPELVQWFASQTRPAAPADAGVASAVLDQNPAVNQSPAVGQSPAVNQSLAVGQSDQSSGGYGVVHSANTDPAAIPPYGAPTGTEPYGHTPGGYAPVSDAYVEQTKPKSRLPKILAISTVSVLLVALVGGLIFWFAIGRKISGSASPEAAVEKLIDSVVSLDQYSLYGSIAPSEITPMLEVFSAAEDRFEDMDFGDTVEYAERIQAALDITISGLEFETVELAQDITRVDIVGGAIEIAGNEAELRAIITEIVEEQFSRVAEEEFTDQMREELEAGMDELFGENWPIQGDLEDLFAEMSPEDRQWFTGIPLVTVQEGGQWYVSPLLSLGEFARIGMEVTGNTGRGGYQYGTVPAAAVADSPEAAVATLTAGIEDLVRTGDAEEFAAALALPERRLLGLHSGLFEDFTGADNELEIVPGGTVVSNNGSVAIVQPKNLTISFLDYRSDPVTLELNEWCARYEDVWNGQSDWGCLDDVLEEEFGADFDLDLSKLGIATVQEDGNWHVSMIHTYAHLTTAVLEIIDEEFLEQLALSPTF